MTRNHNEYIYTHVFQNCINPAATKITRTVLYALILSVLNVWFDDERANNQRPTT